MLARRIANAVYCFSSGKNNALQIMPSSEKEAYLRKIEENAVYDYKAYPALPHQDPTSADYVSCDLDEYHDRVEVEEYNTVIDNFKNDLKIQREVWSAIAQLDRPYKRGIPGIDTNLQASGVGKE